MSKKSKASKTEVSVYYETIFLSPYGPGRLTDSFFDSPVAISFIWWGVCVCVLVFSDQAWLLASAIDFFMLLFSTSNGRGFCVPGAQCNDSIFRFASRFSHVLLLDSWEKRFFELLKQAVDAA
ncbi:hypothetical protein BJX65DRAFT_146110 [Aspergillus insuetus]